MKKKNARILWNTDKNNQITELIVTEFIYEENNPQYLYNKYHKDIGNSFHDWEEWTLLSVIFSLWIQYGFFSRELSIKALKELSKIEEFAKDINFFLSCMGITQDKN